jgi:phage-related protein
MEEIYSNSLETLYLLYGLKKRIIYLVIVKEQFNVLLKFKKTYTTPRFAMEKTL